MKTDDLISQLAGELKPVHRPENAFVFALKWTVAAFLIIAAVIGLIKARADLWDTLQAGGSLLEMLTFAALLFSALLLVSWTSSPGRESKKIYSYALLGIFGICTLLNVVGIFGLSPEAMSQGVDVLGSACTAVAMAVGLSAGAMFAYKARQGASTSPLKMGAIIGLAALGAGGVAITLHCGSTNGMHILMWHFMVPLAAMLAVGLVVGNKILRW
jgi:hypothetical protein